LKPQLRVIPDSLVTPILDEAKRILAQIGVEVRGESLRRRLLDHGLKQARTADDADRILFPPECVDRAIATTPKSFPLFDRDGRPYTEVGGNKVHFVPGSSGLQILDHRSGETRLSRTRDFISGNSDLPGVGEAK
jgi:trimethylamine--corrinoid protein Co-methyltransferase